MSAADTSGLSALKSVVQSLIIDPGKMPQAYAALTANPIYFARRFAPNHSAVYCDDPDAVGMVQALGLDPAVILALEGAKEVGLNLPVRVVSGRTAPASPP
ncbi:hypothetical protein GCM10007880_64890 [Mesorhizobium amorphae]|uniref:hypothetical protein n=1 Tax=Mesorhizobium amorphae TaxID=71433 RepID=UPI00235C6370|nr:hypothetical protein [Mesorhizobium amorphae]GLR45971.1 hypothetical protein GCM10007880_64890 [Mesorhizobium amorphae]